MTIPVALRVKDDGRVMSEAALDLQATLNATRFFENAPFETISIIIKYGAVDSVNPVIGKVNKRYKEIPVTVEVRAGTIKDLHRESLKKTFTDSCSRAIAAVAERFNLPSPFPADSPQPEEVPEIVDSEEAPTLLRFGKSATEYWEAWKAGTELIVHQGVVGQVGEKTTALLASLPTLIADQLMHGYRHRTYGDLVSVTVTVPKSADPLEIQSAANERLGWTGNGFSDAISRAGSSHQVHCWVTDADIAVDELRAELSRRNVEGSEVRVDD